jgi:hypothetical protein
MNTACQGTSGSVSGWPIEANVQRLRTLRPSELLSLFAEVVEELRRREMVRSSNNPVADYAEFLVARALNLTLAPKSTLGYDASDAENRRYEIKARRVTAHNTSRQLSVIRGLNIHHFEFLAGVLFSESFTVRRACLIPIEVVEHAAVYRPHVNGWVLHLRDNLWEIPRVVDITAALKAAEAG